MGSIQQSMAMPHLRGSGRWRGGEGASKQVSRWREGVGGRVGAERERPSHALTILTLLHDIVEERSC